jgi:hypothetical protein
MDFALVYRMWIILCFLSFQRFTRKTGWTLWFRTSGPLFILERMTLWAQKDPVVILLLLSVLQNCCGPSEFAISCWSATQ